jgi:NADH-quinone oxidoreductase subunit N
MGAVSAPAISVAALTPFLFVFGAACVGVLVEAFAPREVRHPVQVGVALVGTVGGLVSTLLLAGTKKVTAGGALAVDDAALTDSGVAAETADETPLAEEADEVLAAQDADAAAAEGEQQ